jgi:type 1 fimbria pilin
MPFKRLSLAILAAATSQAALASPATSTLQFQGAVKSTTCNISVDGVETPNPATVILEPVALTSLGGFKWEEGARFKIALKNCSGSARKVGAIFEPANGSTVHPIYNNHLENMATDNPARNVVVWIRHHHGNGDWRQVALDGDPSGAWFLDNIEDGMEYSANYGTPAGSAPAEGNVEAAVQFTVLYQ